MNELGDVRFHEGRFEFLASIEEPRDWVPDGVWPGSGHYEERREQWEPLATFIVDKRFIEWPLGSDTFYGIEQGMTFADALVAEGWTRPGEPQAVSGVGESMAVLGRCRHGVDLDREFCQFGCRV